jgi:hypothetical protein
MRQKNKPSAGRLGASCVYPSSTTPNHPFFRTWDESTHSEPMALPSMTSSVGIARNLAWHSAGP